MRFFAILAIGLATKAGAFNALGPSTISVAATTRATLSPGKLFTECLHEPLERQIGRPARHGVVARIQNETARLEAAVDETAQGVPGRGVNPGSTPCATM